MQSTSNYFIRFRLKPVSSAINGKRNGKVKEWLVITYKTILRAIARFDKIGSR